LNRFIKTGTVLRFFSAAFRQRCVYRNPVEQQATDSGKILCRKHTMATPSLSGIDGWKKEIRSSANEKAL
jgi:hypothetical protein